MIAVLILSACAPAAPTETEDDLDVLPSATPSPSVTPGPLSPTPPNTPTQPSPTPTQVPVPARLAVLTSLARLIRGGASTEILQAQSADVQVNDQIEIVNPSGQGPQSYSLLQFPGLVNVELLGDTSFSLINSGQGVEGPAEVILELTNGHLFVHLSDQEFSHFTVQTSHATIRALTSGAEFDVCRTEELTCVMVKRGAVEVVTKDEQEIVHAGSAAIVLNDESPPLVICAPIPTFIAWEERFRSSVSASSLQQEIDALPGQECLLGTSGFPLNARIFYRDEFNSAATGWDRGQFPPFTAGYVRDDSGRRYYQVQIQGAGEQYLAFVPNGHDYEDVNIDLQIRSETAGSGDFRYGVIFRRSGEQYYAFVVSPVTETWYFLKNSSTGLQVLKEEINERIRGLEGQDTLHVELYGSTFLLFINGRFIDVISDPDYASGEVGLFVESIDNPNAIVNFNTLTIWDVPPPVFAAGRGENCFNGSDDDGDGLTDLADPSCQRIDAVLSFPTVPPLPTITPRPTSTPRIINTPTLPLPTSTPRIINTPTRTNTPRTPRPRTATPTNTPRTPRPKTPTPTEQPTDPPTAVPTQTDAPTEQPTDPPTAVPTQTDAPTEQPTEPQPTDPPAETNTPESVIGLHTIGLPLPIMQSVESSIQSGGLMSGRETNLLVFRRGNRI